MKILFVGPDCLDFFERASIKMHCKKHPLFVMVQHDESTFYINRDHDRAAELADIARELWTVDLLDQDNGKGYHLLDKASELSNPEAAGLLYASWLAWRNRCRKAAAEQAVKAWRQSVAGFEPEQLNGYDCDFLRALFFTTRRAEQNSPAQKFDVEHSFNKALEALFLYGYQCGQHNAL